MPITRDGESRKLSVPRSIRKGRLPPIAAALAGDIVSAFVPGGGIVAKTVEAIYARRVEKARAIFLCELKQGRKTFASKPEDLDEVVAIVMAYLRCAEEGAAQRNLRLLARVAIGQAAEERCDAARFLSWTSTLASLRFEEIAVVHALSCAERDTPPEQRPNGVSPDAVAAQLAADHTLAEPEVTAYLNALLRTGLVVSNWGLGSGNVFRTTPLFRELSRLASLDDLAR